MSSGQQFSPNKAHFSRTEGTDYATKRGFSIVLDDPLYEDAVCTNRPSPVRHSASVRLGSKDFESLGKSVGHLGVDSGSKILNSSFSERGLRDVDDTPTEHQPVEERGQTHLQSADLFADSSPVQKERQRMKCTLADIFRDDHGTQLLEETIDGLERYLGDDLRKAHPHLFDAKIVEIQPITEQSEFQTCKSNRKVLRVGMVLSGGPAPGGHNVIAGVYDYIKKCSESSQLLGFKAGLDGFFDRAYTVVTDSSMNRFRNSGGFDMLLSGRGKVHEQDKAVAVEVAHALDLHGLIIVGGDGSNSNAAILAEYFAEHYPQCSVIGIPKTIDGDLKNAAIECSFGFDTAAKTYSELIGNLCTDACAGQGVYHFVRVMGRSASHLVLECAMQTRPNLVLIGEEIKAKNISLTAIVKDIADLIEERAACKPKKNYGIILVPEGLIGFIPEMKTLIDELGDVPHSGPGKQFDSAWLSSNSRKVWDFLPETIRDQLLGDREATGYVQEAKIATERLLLLLVEKELVERGFNMDDWNRMHHYFGYEGRCAMPSNFDANYCYNLGYTAGCLVDHGRNGYMAVVRRLVQDPAMWSPCGVPFPHLMTMIELPGSGGRIPGIKRQLVDIESESFKVFTQVRDRWRCGDFYRSPGPIQFQGAASQASNYTIHTPTVADLLAGDTLDDQVVLGHGRALVPKQLGNYSELQHHRIAWTPTLPPLCQDRNAHCVRATQFLPRDPYVRRQILTYYPELSRNNDFFLREVISDPDLSPRGPLRVGIVFLSRQSPGMLNIIWGVLERLKLHGGMCIGFRGVNGLLNNEEFIEITDDDLKPFKNLGGVDLIGRGKTHELLKRENQRQALQTCRNRKLDGLILVGSSLGMTEAALLSEYFIEKGAHTRIIGVPATASNNVLHELIESNVGFDTASKLYSSLIGNVLTDAASMPKYWHFVRLMGRQPSNEVLECALQTHPNVVIIAEEYGAGQKTLADVVNDIAEVVCRRAEGTIGPSKKRDEKKCRNFGAVLIPDGLWHHLPTMRLLLKELDSIMQDALAQNKVKECQNEFRNMSETDTMSPTTTTGAEGSQKGSSTLRWITQLSPWSAAVWRSLPPFIQKEFLTVNPELRDSFVETEVLLSQMVKDELARRAKDGTYTGNFQAVCHYFGYQGRSAMPSVFDCTLAYVHGHLATICIESGVTGHLTNVRGLCGEIETWKLTAVPFNCLLALIPVQQDLQVHPYLNSTRKNFQKPDMPIIPNAEVNLQCKALYWMKYARSKWEYQDRFCNPGPIQFDGTASTFYHRILHEEQAEYFNMLRNVQKFAKILSESCDFGVDESFLRASYVALNGLLTLRFHSGDIFRGMKPCPAVKDFESRLQHDRYSMFQQSHHTDKDCDDARSVSRSLVGDGLESGKVMKIEARQQVDHSFWQSVSRPQQLGRVSECDPEEPPMVSANSEGSPRSDDQPPFKLDPLT